MKNQRIMRKIKIIISPSLQKGGGNGTRPTTYGVFLAAAVRAFFFCLHVAMIWTPWEWKVNEFVTL